MPRRRVAPTRLRRRLTVAFVLVAGVSAGALALGSYLLVRDARLRDSLDRARDRARLGLVLAAGFVPLDDQRAQALLTSNEQAGQHVVLVRGGVAAPSNPSFDPPLPPDLRALSAQGRLGYQRVRHRGLPVLLIGGRIPGSSDELYFVVPEDRIERDLGQLRTVLLAGWGIVVVLAGLVGRTLARRTLDPVARASAAARSVAEGLLDTRLPVEGGDEFAAWAASFNEMAEALEAKIAALSEARARERRFTSDVAHELRTPLTALVGEASLLREHLDRMPEPARRPAQLLIADVARLRRLVDDLIEISRFDAGREEVRPEPVDVLELAGAAVRARGWEKEVEIAGEPVQLTTDRRRLERVLANLVGNAVEHGGGRAWVRVGRRGTSAVVEVVDRGPGIPSEHLPHLFERFYKVDRSRAGAGSGLGLAIAMDNARLLGGDIEVWSEVGVGSRFTLVVPAGA
jgi:signal transduction histidine kinase